MFYALVFEKRKALHTKEKRITVFYAKKGKQALHISCET